MKKGERAIARPCVIKEKKIYFIEIALRLSGGDFSETLIPKSTGVDIIKCAIKNAASLKVENWELQETKEPLYIANRYFFSNKEIYLGDTDIFITI